MLDAAEYLGRFKDNEVSTNNGTVVGPDTYGILRDIKSGRVLAYQSIEQVPDIVTLLANPNQFGKLVDEARQQTGVPMINFETQIPQVRIPVRMRSSVLPQNF